MRAHQQAFFGMQVLKLGLGSVKCTANEKSYTIRNSGSTKKTTLQIDTRFLLRHTKAQK